MMDFHACTWPEPLNGTDISLAAHFDQMNQEPVADVIQALEACSNSSDARTPVITFSHFLPLQVMLLFDKHSTVLQCNVSVLHSVCSFRGTCNVA